MFRSAVVVGTLIVLTCGDPAAPPPHASPYLQVFLSARAAGPGQVLTVSARTTNPGEPILFAAGCGEETGIWFEFLAPDGQRVSLEPPRTAPACLSHTAELPAGGQLTSQARFDGNLYDDQGGRLEQQAGNYIVIVRFRWWRGEPAMDAVVLEKRASFRWRERAVP